MRLARTEIYLLPAVLLGVLALAYAAFRIVGFLGVGMLGLLIGFIAVQIDLEKEGAVGGAFGSSLYARHMMAQQTMSQSERAAHKADVRSLQRPLLIAKIIGGALIIVGFVGFFYLD
jgi:hypothetical protein